MAMYVYVGSTGKLEGELPMKTIRMSVVVPEDRDWERTVRDNMKLREMITRLKKQEENHNDKTE